MSKMLFLGIPKHGHVNPTLGLVEELVNQGEQVVYFCSEEFREKIEKTGAVFEDYGEILKVFDVKPVSQDINSMLSLLNKVVDLSETFIKDLLERIKDTKFDYMGYAAMFPFGNIISQILKLPTVSSFAVFAKPKEIIPDNLVEVIEKALREDPLMDKYKQASGRLKEIYGIQMPDISELFFCKGDINIAYTSKYFVAHPEYYDESFKFIGPPVYESKETSDFPFEKLEGKKVIYISLGTVFNYTDSRLYDIFFDAFGKEDVLVVMTAYGIDISKFNIPENFIVRNYIPQSKILKYTTAAITHAGMNSTSDLLYNNIPFVAIPIGADQPYMAKRASELGAAISLNKDKLTAEELRNSVKEVMTNPSYIENIKIIGKSFREAGGYKEAVKEIFKLKKIKGIS